jgi:hypothetical protein
LPAIPAGALLLANYVRNHLQHDPTEKPALWVVGLHALIATTPFVPALLIAHLLAEHRLPSGKPLFFALAAGIVLAAGIAITLLSKLGLRMLRFVTLVPVILAIAAVLKIGSVSLDRTLSSRPLKQQISNMEIQPRPLAVFHVSREMEYGLTFYRNQPAMRYEWGQIPADEHLLVAPENSQEEIVKEFLKHAEARRMIWLGRYAPQHVDYFWVGAAGAASQP